MKLKLFGIVVATFAIAATSFLGIGSRVSAQDQPPEIKVIIFQGNVTVAGEPAPDGLAVTARVGNDYESAPAFTGAASPGRYTGLVVGNRNDLVGQTIQFWLNGQILAAETDVLAPLTGSGQPCPGCAWTLPLTRTRNLTFSEAPVAPTPTPTATPVVVEPAYVEGRAVVSGGASLDGYQIYARIGDYQSAPSTISGGRFGIVLDPTDESVIGQPIRFFIGDVQAVQTAEFVPGGFRDDLNLVFTSVPQPTPGPSPSPEATRTPTATPSPSPTVTPTATPTLTADGAATATAEAGGGENGGGFCSANAGGPASVGILGIILAPLGLLAAKRLKQARSLPE